jgi:hypothetical protein
MKPLMLVKPFKKRYFIEWNRFLIRVQEFEGGKGTL